MSTTGRRIQELLDTEKDDEYEKLYLRWQFDITDSNAMIENIDYNMEYTIDEHENEIYNMIQKLDRELGFYGELDIDIDKKQKYNFVEIRRNLEDNYRKLSLRFYKHHFDNFRDKSNQLQESQNIIDNNMRSVNGKIENLGATFLNMVLTISIVSTMITLLTKIEFKYALIVIFGCAWLLLTCMIFIISYFKDDDKQQFSLTFPNIIYLALTIITIILFLTVSITNR